MKKLILIVSLIICLIACTGCKLFDLNDWVAPNDTEFTQLVSELDTPYKIAKEMQNFTWNISIHTYSPYQMWLANLEEWNDTGDCDDYATFGMYIANFHGYETYRITMWLKTQYWYNLPLILPHVITVYVEEDKYTYTSNQYYFPLYVDTFQEIVDHHEIEDLTTKSIISWKVYDFEGNLKGESK